MASHWANILLRTTMLTVSLLSKDDILVVNRKAVTSLNKSLVLKMGMVGSLCDSLTRSHQSPWLPRILDNPVTLSVSHR